MAHYFDDSACTEQHTGLVNLLGDDSEPIPNLSPLGPSADEPATFCVRCRSLSNASSNYQNDADAGTREWINSLEDDVKCEAVGNGYHPQSCGDGADMPLLARTDTNIRWREAEPRHCHATSPGNNAHNDAASKQLLSASILCLIFMVAEVVGGYVAGSLAVQTDAAHLLSDLAGFAGSLLALWLVRRPASRRFTFGWGRAEPLAALGSVLLLWAVTVVVGGVAVSRLLVGDYNIDADKMMLVSALGVMINIVMGFALHGGCSGLRHSHHGHSHGLPVRAPTTNDGCELPVSRNINIRAAVIHVVGDLVQSVGVFIAAVLIKFCPGARWVDPACTLLCCVLVICTSLGVARDALMVLLESCPSAPGLQPAALTISLRALEGVRAVHDLHVWSLTPGNVVLTAHIITESSDNNEIVLTRAQLLLRSLPELQHITLQVSSG